MSLHKDVDRAHKRSAELAEMTDQERITRLRSELAEANRQSPGDAQCHVTRLLARAEKAEARIVELETLKSTIADVSCPKEHLDWMWCFNNSHAAAARIAELESQNAQMFNTICVERNTVAGRDRQIADEFARGFALAEETYARGITDRDRQIAALLDLLKTIEIEIGEGTSKGRAIDLLPRTTVQRIRTALHASTSAQQDKPVQP